MKISARGVYALDIMLDIMEYGEKLPVAIKDVANRRDISNKYAEQIVSTLSFAGLVRSIRGPKGGYQATAKAGKETVGTILRLTESVLKDENQEADSENLQFIQHELNDAIDQVIDKYTLTDVLQMKKDVGNDYVI